MDPRIVPLADILRLNTQLFRNCFDGLTGEQANARPSPRTNSAAYVAAHMADSRFNLWTAASRALKDRLEAVTPAELDAHCTTRFPMTDPTVLSVLTFLV